VKATLIDFDDSFTYNLVQDLEETGFSVTVLSWTDFEELPSSGLLVLGPGPGHPDDYLRIYPLIEKWLSSKGPFFGVCLGHQIYWRLQGELVVRSKNPTHGQKMTLQLSREWSNWLGLDLKLVDVQRYNSLCVPAMTHPNPELKNLEQDGEIIITRGKNLLTYQFHPESVGTSYHMAFFRPLLKDLVY